MAKRRRRPGLTSNGSVRRGPVYYLRSVEGRYRLLRQAGGYTDFALVEVIVEPANRDEVEVSPDAFSWLRGVYGKNAVVDRQVNELLIAEAIDGARYVLGRLHPRLQRYRVAVTVIVDSTANTNKGDVKLAAAFATCEAVGIRLEPPPQLDVSGPVFPV
jgi:hypothetical protein